MQAKARVRGGTLRCAADVVHRTHMWVYQHGQLLSCPQLGRYVHALTHCHVSNTVHTCCCVCFTTTSVYTAAVHIGSPNHVMASPNQVILRLPLPRDARCPAWSLQLEFSPGHSSYLCVLQVLERKPCARVSRIHQPQCVLVVPQVGQWVSVGCQLVVPPITVLRGSSHC